MKCILKYLQVKWQDVQNVSNCCSSVMGPWALIKLLSLVLLMFENVVLVFLKKNHHHQPIEKQGDVDKIALG